jgi:hypothetical protein
MRRLGNAKVLLGFLASEEPTQLSERVNLGMGYIPKINYRRLTT